MTIKKFHFSSTGDAYDCTQCDEDIRDGDLLIIESEQVVGVAYTWPFAVTKNFGQLHVLKPEAVDARVDFASSIMAAKRYAEGMIDNFDWVSAPMRTRLRQAANAVGLPEEIAATIVPRYIQRFTAWHAGVDAERVLQQTLLDEAATTLQDHLRKLFLPERAEAFAEAAHAAVGQRRKYTGDPYIEHPRAVAALVAAVTDDPAMIAAAFLHDTVEDTDVTHADIQREFGDDVASLVAALTDVSRPEDGNRAARKTLDRQHIASADPRAKTVKLCDLIDNTASIVAHDPDFARVYLDEKEQLLAVLGDGHPAVFQKATDSLRLGRQTLQRQDADATSRRKMAP